MAGKNRGTLTDNALSVLALLGISLPGFVIGPMLVYVFAVKLGWLGAVRALRMERHHPAGSNARRGAFGDPDQNGAIVRDRRIKRRLRAHSARERVERTHRRLQACAEERIDPGRHGSGLQLGVLLAGAIITEKIFGWPGLGLLLVEDGIGKRDYRIVQGCVLAISMTYIVANTLTDMLYRWLDPEDSGVEMNRSWHERNRNYYANTSRQSSACYRHRLRPGRDLRAVDRALRRRRDKPGDALHARHPRHIGSARTQPGATFFRA